MILAVVALVIILASGGGFFLYHNNQVNQEHANATATVLTRQNATATVIAGTSLTATAIAKSSYPPFTNVSLDDSLTSSSSGWIPNTSCQFIPTGFQVSVAQANILQYCTNSKQFGQMAYQATMTITQGDCGGLIFRFVDSRNLYFFEVCANGAYNLGNYINSQETALYTSVHTSAAIQQGLNKPNVIGITVQGDTVNMYINKQHIDTATNQALASSFFSQGSIGLFADDGGNPTTVVYTNALVWTAS